ncbi:MAG: Gfo/Idh/MocA family oxidoreductase [Gemmatimonadota bacterium]
MSDPWRIAAVGVGRIGIFHAQHVQELATERGDCALVAVVDGHGDLAARAAAQLQPGQEAPIRAFRSVEELLAAGISDGAVIASRTADHDRHTRALVGAGQRVLLEKPLAHTLAEARDLAAWLDADPGRRRAVMQAFQRRFDPALMRAKRLLEEGAIGPVFKVVSILEDPAPPPDGYDSPGLLADMAVHNIDEVLWLTGRRPQAVSGMGARLYNQKTASVAEDFDDAFVQLWLGDDAVAQVQVSRNHVAGYRNETFVYGEDGHLQVGHFEEDPRRVDVEAYGRGARVLEQVSFELRDYGRPVPVFIERFGPAYEAEVAHYVERCRCGEPFEVDHRDGLRALQVVEAGVRSLKTRAEAVPVEWQGGGSRPGRP